MSGGWNQDAENWSEIESYGVADDELKLMSGHYQEVTLDPRDVLVTHQQGSVGSCRGHSGSTLLEWQYAIQTGNVPTVVLSPAFMYYETQRQDGLDRRGDVGSTISGGITVMKRQGCCEDSLWPYVARYNNNRPRNWSEIEENAAKYRIQTSKQLKSYDAIRTWLGSGQGGVDTGISWSSAYSKPIVERYGGGRGGHAVGCPALSKKKDRKGRPYVFMLNSHGEGVGRRGWSEWSPDFIEGAVRNSMNVFIGISDMKDIKPREFTLDDMWKHFNV